jgi:DNA polymerase-4
MHQQRYIAHFDLDSFFVSVEVLKDHSLKGKPVIVGGHNERGVVAACSYEARKFGIHSAMPMKTAMKLCPHAIVVSGSRGDYGRYSRWVTEIIAEKAPLFEKASIDEFYIDLTGMDKYFDVFEWAKHLRQEIVDKTLLPISFGLGSNRMVAKMATNEAKPNGFLFVHPGSETDFLWPLKAEKIPGVGEQLNKTLLQLGMETIGDIAKRSEKELEHQLGKYGVHLWRCAHGRSSADISNYHEAKSISSENTFDADNADIDFLYAELVRLTEKIAHELRDEKKMTECVTVKIRYKDFTTESKQMMIDATDFDHILIQKSRNLFDQLYKKGNKVRLLGVRFSHLIPAYYQGDLFHDKSAFNNLYKAIDEVKNKYGKYSVKRASSN